LRVLGTAERAQVDHRIPQQFHPIVPLLDTFKAEQQPLERILPGKGPLDTHSQRMDGFVEEAFASALGVLVVPGILFDVGDHARIENALAIRSGVKAAIEIDISPSEAALSTWSSLCQEFSNRDVLTVLIRSAFWRYLLIVPVI
jgi:hypothetical protein